MSSIIRQKVPPHPTPEKALINIPGFMISDLRGMIDNAVINGKQVSPVRGIERYYLAELAGFQYNFHYWNEAVLGASYRLRDVKSEWAIEFRSSLRSPDGACRNGPYILMPLLSVTDRVCFDFYLRGDKERFREDMTKLKLFL